MVTGAVGGINLFTVRCPPLSGRLGGEWRLQTRLPVAPGGVAAAHLATLEAAKDKGAQMFTQFAEHVGMAS